MSRALNAGRGARIGALLTLMLVALAAYGDAARDPVERFESTLIESMRVSSTQTFQQRKALIGAMVDSSFDLDIVTRAMIGVYWADLSASERAGLKSRIRDYAITTLTARFVDYDGERFVANDSAKIDERFERVRSTFVAADGEQTQLDYVVLSGVGGMRIVNVYFDGVSGTDIQRGEFAVFLREGGASRLMAKLDELIAAQSR